MDKQVKLKVKVVEERGNYVVLESRLIEGTVFQFTVPARLLDRESETPWLWVTSHGVSADKVSLTLPAQVNTIGNRVTVDKSQLLDQPNKVADVGLLTAPKEMIDHEKKTFTEPIWGDEQGVVIGYMDKVDFDYELGGAKGGNRIFPSVKDLEENKKCVKSCGIVEVEVRLRRVIRESNFDEEIEEARKKAKQKKDQDASR